MALEMGKPLAQGRAEADKCAWVCEHYAEHAERLLAPEAAPTDAARSYVAFEPLGPRARGHAVELPALAGLPLRRARADGRQRGPPQARLERLRLRPRDRGDPARGRPPARRFPRAARAGSARVAALVEDPAVAAVTLTGSTPAGRAVAATAGACLKKTVLELGGSDPYVDPRGRRPRGGRRDLRRRAAGQRRPELHRRQALRRGRGGAAAVPGAPRRAGPGPPDGRPARRGHRRGPPGAARPARRAAPPGRGERRPRAPGRCSAAASPAGPVAFYPPSVLAGVAPGHARLRRGALRAGRGDRGRAGRAATRSGSPTRPSSASGRRSSRATSSAASASRATSSPPAPASSTPPCAPTRGCRSAGSGSPATAGSWGRSGSGSS